MKRKTIIIAVFILLWILFMALAYQKANRQQMEIIDRFNQIDSLIQKRTSLDSLYWEHLEKCAFELKKGVKP